MKYVIVFAALFAVALAAPAQDASHDETVRFDSNVEAEKYDFTYETSGGIKADEAGQLKNIGAENEAIAVHGSFSYVGDDGVTYTVNYVADENGFQPQGAHLPVA